MKAISDLSEIKSKYCPFCKEHYAYHPLFGYDERVIFEHRTQCEACGTPLYDSVDIGQFNLRVLIHGFPVIFDMVSTEALVLGLKLVWEDMNRWFSENQLLYRFENQKLQLHANQYCSEDEGWQPLSKVETNTESFTTVEYIAEMSYCEFDKVENIRWMMVKPSLWLSASFIEVPQENQFDVLLQMISSPPEYFANKIIIEKIS